MLFGGRELPERPLWVRLLTIVFVLSVAAPVIRPGVAALQDQFSKMSAEEAAAQLGKHPLWGAMPAADRDVRCEPGSDGWDYVCSYFYQSKQHRLKVGVRVGHGSLTSVSVPHEINARRITKSGIHR